MPLGRMRGMSDTATKSDWLSVMALVLFVAVVSLSLYAWGYFALGAPGTVSTKYESKPCRFYSWESQAVFFAPAARVESAFANRDVLTRQSPP